MTTSVESNRSVKLRAIAVFLLVVLFAKVLVTIVYEYRWYFPPDFEASEFLVGRRDMFHGIYRAAFYAHILGGPIAVVLGFVLMISGGRARFRKRHRWLGRILVVLVMAIIVPSGLIMSTRAFTGSIAGWGFASLALATAVCILAALTNARGGQFAMHQRWATRGFILLISPLLLRIMSGAAIVFQIESHWTYPLNAWLSWVMPLAIYELGWRISAIQKLKQSLPFADSARIAK